MDLYARSIVGWVLSNGPDSQFKANALRVIFKSYGYRPQQMFHFDQGGHYISIEFRKNLWCSRVR